MSATIPPFSARDLALLSDTRLYNQAVTFVEQNAAVEAQQLHALLEFSQDWAELNRFVEHQSTRNWQQQGNYKEYYIKLKRELDAIEREVRTLLPASLPTTQRPQAIKRLATPRGREFIQHLWAEGLFRRRQK